MADETPAAPTDGTPGQPGATDETMPAAEDDTIGEPGAGTPFRIPQIIAEGVPTVDGRMVELGAVEGREGPLPLMGLWENDGDGHEGAVLVGSMRAVVRDAQGVWSCPDGVFDTSEDATECVRLIQAGMLTGISVDMAVEDYRFEITGIDEEGNPTGELFVVTKGTLVGATVCPMPAQTGCAIELADTTPVAAAGLPVRLNLIFADGCLPCQDRAADQVLASGGPVTPPAAWFDDPQLPAPTPLTVTDDGRVYGHLAEWGTCHTGIGNACVQPPRSGDYGYFATGVIRTAEGSDVNVGQLTLAGGHADLRAGWRAAMAHYDDTHSAVADVAVGEDAHGVWLAGALRPGVTEEQLRAFRASPPSGDWRPIAGQLKLVAACAVNVQGFPIVRAQVAAGVPIALVAGGVRAPVGDETPAPGTVAAALPPEVVDELRAWRLERAADRALAQIDRATSSI